MGRKNIILPVQILRAEMSQNQESIKTNVQFMDNIGLQVKWDATDGVGIIRVKGSNNWDPHLLVGDFESLTFNPALAQPSSDSDGYLIDLQQFPFSWLMLTYEAVTPDTGPSLIECWLTAKEI